MARKPDAVAVDPKHFRIMDLPPEIRNCIWRLAVIADHPIEVRHHLRRELIRMLPPSTLRCGRYEELHREGDVAAVISTLAIALTCRQVYLEVTPLYYSQNAFRFHYNYAGHRSMTVFTRAMKKAKARSIIFALSGVVDGDNPEPSCLQRSDTHSVAGWSYVGMDMVFRRPLDLQAGKNPDLVLIMDGKPRDLGD